MYFSRRGATHLSLFWSFISFSLYSTPLPTPSPFFLNWKKRVHYYNLTLWQNQEEKKVFLSFFD